MDDKWKYIEQYQKELLTHVTYEASSLHHAIAAYKAIERFCKDFDF